MSAPRGPAAAAPAEAAMRFSFVVAEGVNARNNRAVTRDFLPNERLWNAAIIAAFALSVIAPILGPVIGRDLSGAGPLFLVVGLAVALYRIIVRIRRRKAALEDAPVRQDASAMTLDAEGFAIEHPGLFYKTSWSHVVKALATPDSVLILTSPVEYVPIPMAALPVGVTPDDLAARINAWIAAAKKSDWGGEA